MVRVEEDEVKARQEHWTQMAAAEERRRGGPGLT